MVSDIPCITFVPPHPSPTGAGLHDRPRCPLPTPAALCTRKRESCAAACGRKGPAQWPLVCPAFLLKQAQIRAAPASTPTGTDSQASGEAAWPPCPLGLEVVSGLERVGLWGRRSEAGRACDYPQPPLFAAARAVFLKTVLMVSLPESVKRGPHVGQACWEKAGGLEEKSPHVSPLQSWRPPRACVCTTRVRVRRGPIWARVCYFYSIFSTSLICKTMILMTVQDFGIWV